MIILNFIQRNWNFFFLKVSSRGIKVMMYKNFILFIFVSFCNKNFIYKFLNSSNLINVRTLSPNWHRWRLATRPHRRPTSQSSETSFRSSDCCVGDQKPVEDKIQFTKI